MASNIYLKQKGPAGSSSRTEPGINLTIRSKLLEYMRAIKDTSRKIKQLKGKYMSTNDFSSEQSIQASIGEMFQEINKNIACMNKMIRTVKQDIAERKKVFNDQLSEDTGLRFLEVTVNAVQSELYIQVNSFNKLQFEIKTLFKSKMHRKLLIYDPKVSEAQVTDLMLDQKVG